MKTQTTVPGSIDDYIAGFSGAVKEKLDQLRGIIRKAAPAAIEGISYQMPAYKHNGPLVYFAACKTHIGFYPTPSAIEAFKKDLSAYTTSKGAVQFPLDQPLPQRLISAIVAFRVKENQQLAELKAARKK